MSLPSCRTSTNVKSVLLKPVPCMCQGIFASVLSCMLSDHVFLHLGLHTDHGLLCFALRGRGFCRMHILSHTLMLPASPVCHNAFAEHASVEPLFCCMHVLSMQV